MSSIITTVRRSHVYYILMHLKTSKNSTKLDTPLLSITNLSVCLTVPLSLSFYFSFNSLVFLSPFLSSILAFFFHLFLPSFFLFFLPSFLPFFLLSLLPSLTSFLSPFPFLLPSFLPSFFLYFLPSFLFRMR